MDVCGVGVVDILGELNCKVSEGVVCPLDSFENFLVRLAWAGAVVEVSDEAY